MFKNDWQAGMRITALSVAMASATGCLVANNSQTTFSGTQVAPSTFEQIKPGSTTINWVRAALGEASSKTKDGSDEIWKYTYKEHTDSSGYVFLVFAGNSSNETVNTVFIEFKDGIVTNKWRG